MKNVTLQLFVILCFALPVYSQDAERSTLSSIGRVETVEGANFGTGTGFVAREIETDSGTSYEVWTAAHVVERVGQQVSIRFDVGSENEKLVVGVVTYRKYDSEHDAAVIECEGDPPRHVLRIASSEVGDVAYFAGYSGRYRWRAIRIIASSIRGIGGVRLFVPESSPGESGAPVWTSNGVSGVVTAYTETAVKRLMMHPISHWVDRDK